MADETQTQEATQQEEQAPVYSITVNADAEKGHFFPGVPSEIKSLDTLCMVKKQAPYFQPQMFTVTVTEPVAVEVEVEGQKQTQVQMQTRTLQWDEVLALVSEHEEAKAEEREAHKALLAQRAHSAAPPPASRPVDGTEPKRGSGRGRGNK